MPATERKRVFLAVWPSEEALEELASGVEAAKNVAAEDPHIQAAIRWIKSGVWHLTVVFVGSVDVTGLGELRDEASRVASASRAFEITFAGAGAFPGIRRPRVLWLGVGRGGEAWREFAGAVRKAVAARLPLEREREHAPHMTVARVRRPVDVGAVVDALGRARPVSMTVSKLSLIESRLMPSGAEYTTLEEFELSS